jgi:TonB family protein
LNQQFFSCSPGFRSLALSVLLLFCNSVKAQQDTIYYDKDAKVTRSRSKAQFLKVVEREMGGYSPNDPDRFIEKSFFKTGQIMQEEHYMSRTMKVDDGKLKKWFENGQLRADMNYRVGILVGELVTYWRNGKLRRKDEYDIKGKLVKGDCYDSTGAKIPYFNFKKIPFFEYYKGDLDRYFFDHIKYPRGANRSGIGGTVVLSFMVEKDGSVSGFKIAQSSGNRDLDSAALEVFYGMPKWEPGTEDGEPVKMPYEYSMKFSPGW